MRIAINGLGRIGRLALRAWLERDTNDLQVVAVNDLAPVDTLAHLLRYDSVHPKPAYSLQVKDRSLILNQTPIAVFQEADPQKLPWSLLNVDLVLECTGRLTHRDQAYQHVLGGARKVLISAPATNADLTIVYGVNHHLLRPSHTIVSNASCTTNCLAPIALILNDALGIKQGLMTTIHSYTSDQPLIDSVHKDLNRARAGALNIIPTSTGAAKAVANVLPQLQGKIDGISIRVPTPNVSLIDFTFVPSRPTTANEINALLQSASQTPPLDSILACYNIPLVSSDFNHTPHSAIIALQETTVIDRSLARVLAWYDNEWAFAQRMIDTALALARTIDPE